MNLTTRMELSLLRSLLLYHQSHKKGQKTSVYIEKFNKHSLVSPLVHYFDYFKTPNLNLIAQNYIRIVIMWEEHDSF